MASTLRGFDLKEKSKSFENLLVREAEGGAGETLDLRSPTDLCVLAGSPPISLQAPSERMGQQLGRDSGLLRVGSDSGQGSPVGGHLIATWGQWFTN